jgi:hypothetical protein
MRMGLKPFQGELMDQLPTQIVSDYHLAEMSQSACTNGWRKKAFQRTGKNPRGISVGLV